MLLASIRKNKRTHWVRLLCWQIFTLNCIATLVARKFFIISRCTDLCQRGGNDHSMEILFKFKERRFINLLKNKSILLPSCYPYYKLFALESTVLAILLSNLSRSFRKSILSDERKISLSLSSYSFYSKYYSILKSILKSLPIYYTSSTLLALAIKFPRQFKSLSRELKRSSSRK